MVHARLDYPSAHKQKHAHTRARRYRDDRHDLEAAEPSGQNGQNGQTSRDRFRDVVGSVIADGRRRTMQKTLIDGADLHTLEPFRKTPEQLKHMDKKIRKFYEAQNEKLNDWLEIDTLVKHLADDIVESFDPHDDDNDGVVEIRGLQASDERIEEFLPDEEREKRRKNRKYTKWAININVIANVFLLIAKIVAVFFSSSLSLVASLTDSALDLLCTLIIFATSMLVMWKIQPLTKKFPIGRRRLEPIGILVFSVIMVVSFLQILKESFDKLTSPKHKVENLPPTAIFAQLITVIVKGIIGLGCLRFESNQVRALVQDCKTDVIFNTVSLLFPLIGGHADIWWLDPVGAGLLSIYIIYDWAETCLEHVCRLTGIGVEDRLLSKLLYLAWRFSPVVDAYKSITAYHAGDGVWCEVDIILNEKTPLEHSHDVAETLQYCLEGLDEVDRAFVSCDYASRGPAGHLKQNP